MDVQHRIASDGNRAYRPVISGAERAGWSGSRTGGVWAGAPTSNAIVTHSACQKLRSPPEVLAQLIGEAPAFKDIVSRLPALARADGSLLITGETGTGKELSPRHSRTRPAGFASLRGGELRLTRRTLLESELFGHERGAFTDAHARRQGLIARAAGGTLFLDEVETLTPRGQVALLRVVHERTFRPVGSTSEQRVDARFVAATNGRLDRLVQAGSFRADLYYRLCVFSITLPPLHERQEDILPLALYFLAKHAGRSGPAPKLSPVATETLLAFDWPGNVRELESAIVRAAHVARGGVIEVGDLGLPGGDGGAGWRRHSWSSRLLQAQKAGCSRRSNGSISPSS